MAHTAAPLRAMAVLRGDVRDDVLGADHRPQVLRGVVQPGADHLVEPGCRLASRHQPAIIGQQLQVPADGRLRKLEYGAQLADRKLMPLKK